MKMDNSPSTSENINQDEMNGTTETQEKKEIQTFAFLDIEATGLPGDDPRILELAIIAVSRNDLLSMSDAITKDQSSPTHPSCSTALNGQQKLAAPHLPRVLHKYTRLYYPKKLISPKVEEITGLNNDLLYRLPGFNEGSAEAINHFLDLPKPVALVAHNGSRYDFPLLKAELNNVSSSEKFDDLHCVDTLKAIKDIDALKEKEDELKDIHEITQLAESFDFEDMDDEMMEEAPSSKRSRSEEFSEERLQPSSSCSDEHSSRGNQRIFEISPQPHMTPVKDRIPAQMTATPKTPPKLPHPPVPPITPESSKVYCSPGTPNLNTQSITETNKVRRNLTYGQGKRKYYSQPYKQTNLYKRLFGSDYDAHRAESDCQAMLQICGHYGEQFVAWSDTFADKFTSFKPMWTRSNRKTFQIT